MLNERDKIAQEILSRIYPMEELNNYYNLGAATMFYTLKSYFEDPPKEEFTAKELVDLFNRSIEDQKEIYDLYVRLNKKDDSEYKELEYFKDLIVKKNSSKKE